MLRQVRVGDVSAYFRALVPSYIEIATPSGSIGYAPQSCIGAECEHIIGFAYSDLHCRRGVRMHNTCESELHLRQCSSIY